jgi:hypothetical protein
MNSVSEPILFPDYIPVSQFQAGILKITVQCQI